MKDYIKTNWKSGDLITEANLNKIETQLADTTSEIKTLHNSVANMAEAQEYLDLPISSETDQAIKQAYTEIKEDVETVEERVGEPIQVLVPQEYTAMAGYWFATGEGTPTWISDRLSETSAGYQNDWRVAYAPVTEGKTYRFLFYRGSANRYHMFFSNDETSGANEYKILYNPGTYTAGEGQEYVDSAVAPEGATKIWVASKCTAQQAAEKLQIWEVTEPTVFTQITGIGNLLNTRAPAVMGEETGSVISVDDGADDFPRHQLVCSIEPVQDLHGYENPWPGGGSKNLLPMTVGNLKTINITGTWSDLTYTHSDITFTILTDAANNITGIKVNGTASADARFDLAYQHLFAAGSYTVNGCPAGGSSSTYRIFANYIGSDTGSGSTGTLDGVNTTSIYIQVKSGTAVSNQEYKPMLRLSSVEDGSFVPYTNICPITGYTGTSITRCGKNLLPNIKYQSDSKHVYLGANSTGYDIPLKAGTYKLSYGLTSGVTSGIYWRIEGGSVQDGTNVTIAADTNFKAWLQKDAGISAEDVLWFQLEKDSTATTYEPYQSNTYNITFPSETGAIYGGTLDVLTGVLTVDRRIVDLGTLTWDLRETGLYRSSEINDIKPVSSQADIVQGIAENYRVYRYSYAKANLDQFVIGMNNDQKRIYVSGGVAGTGKFVYELETPSIYQLTPHEVKTLLGVNNIWCTTGNVNVAYIVDTKLYIDKKLANMYALILENIN